MNKHLTSATKIALVSAIFFLLAWAGIALTRQEGPIAAVWLPNGFLLAVMMRTRRGAEKSYLGAGLIASFASYALSGDSIDVSAALACANIIEVAVVFAGMVYTCGVNRDMTNLKHLGWFIIIAGVIAPAISGLIAALTLSSNFSQANDIWQTWFMTDALGLVIGVPFLLTLNDAWRERKPITQRKVAEWCVLAIVGAVCLCLVFFQTRFPFLFVVLPLAPLFAFRLGTAGTAVYTAMTAIIATIATELETGPISMIVTDGGDQLHVLQAFLGTCFLMGLPLAAALKGREKDQAQLRKQQEVGRSMLENMREVVFRTDSQGKWIFLNPAWTELTGIKVTDSLGRSSLSNIHPATKEAAAEMWRKFAAGEVTEATVRQRMTDIIGGCRHVDISVKALTGGKGQFRGTIGSIRDVTEQVKANNAIAQRESQLAILASNATDAVFKLDLQGRCLYASPSAKLLLGSGNKDLIGVNILTRFHPDDEENVKLVYNQLASGAYDRTIITYRSKPVDERKEWLWLEANCGLVRDENDQPAEVIVSIRDVTARKELEFELAAARDNAEQAATAKSTFLANMSHEIRTPMNGVIGFADLLLNSPMSDEQRHQVQMIAESGRTMMRLLNDILDISKVEAGQMTITKEPVDLRHVFRGCLRLVEPAAQAKGLELHCRVPSYMPPNIMADGLRLRQIILNILSNAVKFTEKGEVTIAAREVDAKLRITVTDTGIGIPQDRLEAIFEPFRQAEDGTARRFGGTGLGLTISHQLANLMDGDLTVASTEGKGTTFTLTLPMEVAQGSARNVNKDSAVQKPSRKARILLAEDHDVNQQLFASMLSHLGHEMELAQDGAEAVAKALTADGEGRGYDLVLMDLQMPVVDGIRATELIRGHGVTAEKLPILALTANAYSEDIERCLAAGMQAHIAKPVQLETLASALAQWLPEKEDGESLPAAIELGLPPEMMALYASREEEAKGMLEKWVANPADKDVAQQVAEMMHKIAGTAGMFGRDATGQSAGRIEAGTDTWKEDEIASNIEAEMIHWRK